MTDNEAKRLAQEAAQKALRRITEQIAGEVMPAKMPNVRTEPPPIVKMPDDMPRYIQYLVTAQPGKEPRGDLGGGVYEASAEVAAMLFYMNYGWW